ncbi:MAG: hypothetical protein O3C40_10290 [Planctomycetota bacterium]|nr:hypothetical protein [Planctomycetota bacterium]
MQEIRILFSPSAENSCVVSLTDGDGHSIGVEVLFEPFLTDDDYDLRWYLEEYMELPDGGAVVRAEQIEADLPAWVRRLHDAVFLAGENRAALDRPRSKGVRESAGINRLGIGNERVLQRRPSQLLWPRTVRWRW